jgi:hypothetical protein
VRNARQLSLTTVQHDELDAMSAELDNSQSQLISALETLKDELVHGIRAGHLATDRLRADEAAIDASLRARHDIEADVLNDLHAMLDVGRRQALADWVAATGQPQPDGLGGDEWVWTPPSLYHLSGALSLDDRQREKVAALLAKNTGAASNARTARRALLTAFASTQFDAHAALRFEAPDLGTVLRARVALLAQLLPLLRPDQRGKLAALIERLTHNDRTPAAEGSPALL